MTQSFPNQRPNTRAGGTRPFEHPNNSSVDSPQPLPAAEIESLLKLAYENLRQLTSRMPAEEIGPGDVQYLRGDSVPDALRRLDATAPDWLPMQHPDPNGAAADDLSAGTLPEVQDNSPGHNFDLPEIREVNAATSPIRLEQHGLTLDDLGDVELEISIELGHAEVLIEDLLKLREGSVVALDKLAGDPVDIVANGRLVGRGELLVVDGKFGVRLSEVL